MKAVVEKHKNTTPWQVLVRQRVPEQRALALIELLPTFELFSTNILAFVKPENTLFTTHFANLVEKLRVGKSAILHMKDINDYCSAITDSMTNDWDKFKQQQQPNEEREKVQDETFDILLENIRRTITRDCLTSILGPTFASIGKWERQENPIDADPINIALWAEARGSSKEQMLRLDVSGGNDNWIISSTQPSGSPGPKQPLPTERRRSSVWCEWCNRTVTTHLPAKCWKNPVVKNASNNPKDEEYYDKTRKNQIYTRSKMIV